MGICIKNAFIVTMDSQRRVFENGEIYIKDGKIIALGETVDCTNNTEVIDAKGKTVLPGLINGHNHFEQSFMKGVTRFYGGGTSDWIRNFKIRIMQHMTREDYYLSHLLTAMELIKNGITSSVNHVCQQDPAKLKEYGLEAIVQAVEDSGIRCVMAVGASDKFETESFLLRPAEASKFIEDAIKKWNGSFNNRLKVWAGPAGVWSVSENLWNEIKSIVDEYDTGIHFHLASFQTGEVIEANRYGFLGPNVTGAHCVWLSDMEMEIMRDTGMKVVHNPVYKLSYAVDSEVSSFGDGIAPVMELLDRDVTVALGQDGCMGDVQDLFKEMRCLAYTQQYRQLKKKIFPPSKLLEMVTVDGAEALCLGQEVGSLEVGKKADLIIIDDVNNPNYYPRTNRLASLVYQGSGADVQTVIIDGKLIMSDRKIIAFDEGNILEKAEKAASGLIDRAGFSELKQFSCSPWISSPKF